MTKLWIDTERLGAWTRVQAEYRPPLAGTAATAAGETVLAATEAVMPQRRTRFWVSLGLTSAVVPTDAKGRALILDALRSAVGREGDLFAAVCRKEDAPRLAAAFRAIAEVG